MSCVMSQDVLCFEVEGAWTIIENALTFLEIVLTQEV
jgi:hypothetical protein